MARKNDRNKPRPKEHHTPPSRDFRECVVDGVLICVIHYTTKGPLLARVVARDKTTHKMRGEAAAWLQGSLPGMSWDQAYSKLWDHTPVTSA